MEAVAEFSELVAGIYAAALVPERWNAAMGAIGRVFDARAALVITDRAAREIKYADIPPDAARSYAEHFAGLDHVLSAVQTGPIGAIRPGAELIWPYQRCEFATDWARPNGFEDGMFIRLNGPPVTTSLAIATPRRSDRFDTPENVELVRSLLPHLQQALCIQIHVDDVVQRSSDVALVSEVFGQAVVVVRPGGWVVGVNAAAEAVLRSADGVQIRHGRIEAMTAAAEAQLQTGIAHALARGPIDVWGGSFRCARPSGRRPYVVHVLPGDRVATATPRPDRALIVIVDPERHPEPPAALLRHLYGLTNNEARVALMVTRAEGLQPIADELSVSMTTVKTHLRHVFDKTGTRRQAELVRLLLMLDPTSR